MHALPSIAASFDLKERPETKKKGERECSPSGETAAEAAQLQFD
jgi:hypothetical protein